MIKIEYPTWQPKIKEEAGKELIFDEIRRRWVTLTPEEWVRQNFCAIRLSDLEPANAHETYPEGYAAVSDVAARLLVKTTPDGIKAIINYYTLLSRIPKEQAFARAFGRNKEEFYKQYQDECDKRFPTVKFK